MEGRYQKAYEERINPFGDFRDKEKAARKQKMNVADRVIYEFGQIISSSQCADPSHPPFITLTVCLDVLKGERGGRGGEERERERERERGGGRGE